MTSKDRIFQLKQLKKLIHTHDTPEFKINTDAIDYAMDAIEKVEKYEQAIFDIRTRILIIREEDYECDGCSDMDMVLDIIDECLGESE